MDDLPIDVAMHPSVVPAFKEWLADHGLEMVRLPDDFQRENLLDRFFVVPSKEKRVSGPMTLEVTLRRTSNAALLRTFAALTHRMHDQEDDRDFRTQRDHTEREILRRMRRE